MPSPRRRDVRAAKVSPEPVPEQDHASEPASRAELEALIRAAPPLVPGAAQAVLGEGPDGAPVAFVGEQPGDQEEQAGRPFVGPAGKLLDRAMGEAGFDRTRMYVTNAVKHFKYVQRGKRRIHQKPSPADVAHYRWWLDQELRLVAPRVIVAMGTTAVLALTGKPLPILRFRGPADLSGRRGFITVHPSYLLRLPESGGRREAYARFVEDLRAVKRMTGRT